MENESLINAYIANLAKSVNDLTLENLLLKSKQQHAASESNEVAEQVRNQDEEIKELKENEEILTNEKFALKQKAKEDEEFIERLEAGIEQANGIIAQFEQEKDAAVAKVATLEKELKSPKESSELKKLREEKQTLFNQNVQLLKDLDFTEKKIKELKDKLRAKPQEENLDVNSHKAETIGDSEFSPGFR